MGDREDSELSEILEEVRRIEVQSRRLVTDVMAGGYVSVFRGSGIEFDTVREYVEGDAQRSVDWNVTARMGRPFVKTYVDERELTVLFLLDLSRSMDGGFGVWSARQTAARICACLALAATRSDDKVGLIAFSQDVDAYVRPKKGVSHALRIIRDCLVLRGSMPCAVPGTALELAMRVVSRRAVLFLLSDFLGDSWEEALRIVRRRHDVVAVRLLPPELDPSCLPPAGLVRLRDPETGRTTLVDTSSRRVREAYERRVETWRRRSEAMLEQVQVDRMDVPIPRVRGPDDIAGPIMRFFRMRQLRGAKR